MTGANTMKKNVPRVIGMGQFQKAGRIALFG